MFGGISGNYTNAAFKYNLLTNTKTSIANLPGKYYYQGAIAVGTDIYLFGGRVEGGSGSVLNTPCLKYDILTNTYTTFNKYKYLQYHSDFSPVLVNNENGQEIYIMVGGTISGGDYYGGRIMVLSLGTKSYDKDNAIILVQNQDYKFTTEIFDSNIINGLQYEFNDVYYYTQQDGLDNSIPTYYGDGTQWIKFKN